MIDRPTIVTAIDDILKAHGHSLGNGVQGQILDAVLVYVASQDPAPAFKPGDLVVLRSGGPVMTVEELISTSLLPQGVNCAWFSRAAQQLGTFSPDVLLKVSA